MAGEPYLYDFYGTECTHCHEMDPLVDELEKETGLTIIRLEVWHNAKNAELLAGIDDGSKCGAVPFFWNAKSKKWICGATSYDKLKEWALGK